MRRRTSILRPKRPEEHPFGVQQLANDCTLVDKSGYQKYGHPSSWHHAGRRGRSNIKCAPSLESNGAVFSRYSPRRVNSK